MEDSAATNSSPGPADAAAHQRGPRGTVLDEAEINRVCWTPWLAMVLSDRVPILRTWPERVPPCDRVSPRTIDERESFSANEGKCPLEPIVALTA